MTGRVPLRRLLAVRLALTFVALLLFVTYKQQAIAQAVEWPQYGLDRDTLTLQGFTNSLPDIVGPVDGSARLTIFTEGNHYPILLPLVLDAFPKWCKETRSCTVTVEDILIVTLPQVMIVQALEGNGIRFGNAYLPLDREGPVFPDLIMGGRGPLSKLAAKGLIEKEAQVFARHRGLGILIRSDSAVKHLDDLAQAGLRLAVATPGEAGARRQYQSTLEALVGMQNSSKILAADIGEFPGRLGIQHRDVPYALLNNRADAGIIFDHLAAFYAQAYPDSLRHVAVPDAAPFGEEIAVARALPSELSEAFLTFFMAAAPEAYARAGFYPADEFEFGRRVALNDLGTPRE
ncbi:MAG: substrate-binding domain-containing protein [Pseudomonadota bacterium]